MKPVQVSYNSLLSLNTRFQSHGTLASFVLAMVRNAGVLRKAQEELDRVVGPDRLPEFGDRESLPYLNAVLEELYR